MNLNLINHAQPICTLRWVLALSPLARSGVGWMRPLPLCVVTFALFGSEEWGWASLWPLWRVDVLILLVKNLLSYLRFRIVIDQLCQINIELGNVCLQFLNIHYPQVVTWGKWIWRCRRRSILQLAVIQKHIYTILRILGALRHKVNLIALLIILWDPDPLHCRWIFPDDLFIGGL